MKDRRKSGVEPVAVVWYPGSGRDVGLCVTDIESNPLGRHLRRADGTGSAVLWMSDFDPDLEANFGSEAQQVDHLESLEATRRLHVGSVSARSLSRETWPELRSGRDFTRRERQRYWPGRSPTYDIAKLEVSVERRYRHGRPVTVDVFEVWFSPFESRAMAAHVLPQWNVQLVGLVLLGGMGIAASAGFNHHSREFLELVRDRVGLPQYVITDRGDGSPWGNSPFRDTGHELRGWKGEWSVRLYERT